MMSMLQATAALGATEGCSRDHDFLHFVQSLDPLFDVPLQQESNSSERHALLSEPFGTCNSYARTPDAEPQTSAGVQKQSTTASERTKLLNRQHQKRHRQKKKVTSCHLPMLSMLRKVMLLSLHARQQLQLSRPLSKTGFLQAKMQQLEAQLKLAQQQLQSKGQSVLNPPQEPFHISYEPKQIPGQLMWQVCRLSELDATLLS